MDVKKRKELVISLSIGVVIIAFFSFLFYVMYLHAAAPNQYTNNNLAFIGVDNITEYPTDAYQAYKFRDSRGDHHTFFGDREMAFYLSIESNYRISYTINNEEFPKNYRLQEIIPVDAVKGD